MRRRRDPGVSVEVSPWVCQGRPVVAGTRVRTDVVAVSAMTDGLLGAASEFGLSVPQVIAACWFEGKHGGRRELRSWAWRYQALMASGRFGQVPDPAERFIRMTKEEQP